ncbi:MAG: ArnT family glycosyltransferase, partial [Candidatus Ratteibacteria bacterium]
MVNIKKKYSLFFYLTLFFTLILKLFLSFFFPLTGDEAYFITTGKTFDVGYYEHPPMIWWIIYIFSCGGKYTFHFFYYRLFSVFSTLVIVILILRLLREEKNAYLISSLFLFSPVYLLSFLITNDIPLLLFTFFSGTFFFKGIKEEKKIFFVISGIFFGLAFLSKYLSILYLAGIFCFTVFKNERKYWKNFIIFIFSSLPLIFINFYWNYNHCWINFLFNLVYRKKTEYLKIKNIVLFFLSLFFLITPYLFFLFLKEKFFIRKKLETGYDFFFFVFSIPVFLLFLLSFLRAVGLHWYISFIPFSFLLLRDFEENKILKSIKIASYFDGFIIIIIISLLLSSVNIFKNHKKYSEIIMFKNPYSVCDYLNKFKEEYIFATPNYTHTAIMSYYCKKDFIVFGDLGHSGREYDITFDFKKIDGKDILIFSPVDIEEKKYLEFFEN